MSAQKTITTQAAKSAKISVKKKYESPRQLERQAKILAATREMLAEVGYSATTMRDLAVKANVAPGTLYNLYKSKDALIFAAVEDLLTALGVRANESSVEGLERILALAEEMAFSICDGPQYAEAMSRALFRAERDDPLTKLLYARSTPFIEHQIEVAKQRGQLLPDTDAKVYARQIQAQNWGVILAWVMGPVPLAEFRSELLRAQIMILLSTATPSGRQWLEDYRRQI